MIIAAYLLSFLPLILNASLFVHLKPAYNFYLAFSLQLAAEVLSPFLAVLGLLVRISKTVESNVSCSLARHFLESSS